MHFLFKKNTVTLLFSAVLFGCAHHGIESLPTAPITSNKTAHRIHELLPNYAKLSQINWPVITSPKMPLKIGDDNSAVAMIRERLIWLGDMPKQTNTDSKKMDSALQYGVMQFQWRHGLKSNGIINQTTLDALNVTPRQRYHELISNMQEWAQLPENEGSHYIHVNIPSFKLRLIRNGDDVLSMNVIAGRATRPTPTLYSKVQTLVFNPPWNVPETIIKEDVIPGMQKNPRYLKEHHDIKVYTNWDKNAPEIDPLTIDWHNADANNFAYRLTAPPGDNNPLGRVKFIFDNEEDIYMHDTPQKELFADMKRAYSSGCIRLEHPFQLVEYFYSDNQDLNHELVNQYLSTTETKYIQLKNPIPIYVTYITAWVDGHGRVHFREDIYRSVVPVKAH